MKTEKYIGIVLDEDREIVEKRIADSNKKLAKMQDVAPIVATFSDENDFEESSKEYALMNQYKGAISKITIEYPSISNISGIDCSFVGTLAMEGCDESNKQYAIQNEEDFQNIKSLDLTCMCCGKKSRRNMMFYFKKSCGEYLAIGKNCAKNYFPFDPSRLIDVVRQTFITLEELEELLSLGLINGFSWGGNKKVMGLREVFHYTAGATNNFSTWEKKSIADSDSYSGYSENPKGTVLMIETYRDAFNDPKSGYNGNENIRNRFNAIMENVTVTYEYMAELFDKYFKNPSDDWDMFTSNMHNALYMKDENGEFVLRTYISMKNLGVVAYAFKKAYDMDAKEKTFNLKAKVINSIGKNNGFYGNIGDKFKGNAHRVTLLSTRSFEGAYGFTFVYNMRDSEGNMFVWFASNSIANLTSDKVISDAISQNKPVSFDIVGGSIKDHKVYTNKNGESIKQTIVTRCSLDNFELVA